MGYAQADHDSRARTVVPDFLPIRFGCHPSMAQEGRGPNRLPTENVSTGYAISSEKFVEAGSRIQFYGM